MRNADAQRAGSMIPVGAMHQPPCPHVSHAEIGGLRNTPFAIRRRSEAKTSNGGGIRSAEACACRDERDHARMTSKHCRGYDGQRCALLTTKSRNTCTRATVFNSSG
jgi:hypothetical protein